MSFTRHTNCEKCGSSDANAVYSDGTTYCFSCGVPSGGKGGNTKPSTSPFFSMDLMYQPLKSRSLTKKTCQKFGYGISKYRGQPCQVAPFYRKGTHVANLIRLPDKEFRWTGDAKKLEMFGQSHWDQGGRRLVITEGILDMLSVSQVFDHKYPVVSLINGVDSTESSLKDNLDFVESFDEIVLAFDDDDPGKKAVEAAVSILTPGKVKRALYNGHNDANAMLVAGEGGVLPKLLWQAAPYRPDDIISGDELWEELNTPDELGYSLPYPKLSQIYKGFRKKELYLFTAGSGIGKSTVAKEICYHFRMHHDLSLGVMSLEEGVKKATNGFIAIDQNVHVNDVYTLTSEQRKESFDKLVKDDKFHIYKHWGSTQIDNILNKIKFMALSLECDWILLDHISIIVSGSNEMQDNERKLIDLFMTKLRTLIEHTGVGVIAIVHLKRPPGDKGWTEGRRVSLSDLRGSGALEQTSDGVVALERDQQGNNQNISIVRVLKNRPIGPTGETDTLSYNPTTGRLLVAEENDFNQPQGETIDDF